jgi:hypothetical protein
VSATIVPGYCGRAVHDHSGRLRYHCGESIDRLFSFHQAMNEPSRCLQCTPLGELLGDALSTWRGDTEWNNPADHPWVQMLAANLCLAALICAGEKRGYQDGVVDGYQNAYEDYFGAAR